MYVEEPLFDVPDQPGFMYLLLPHERVFGMTELKIGWSGSKYGYEKRLSSHKKRRPGMEGVALWVAGREYEEHFHARHRDFCLPREKEWYFPDLRLSRDLAAEMQQAEQDGTLTWISPYNMTKFRDRMIRLVDDYHRHMIKLQEWYAHAKSGS